MPDTKAFLRLLFLGLRFSAIAWGWFVAVHGPVEAAAAEEPLQAAAAPPGPILSGCEFDYSPFCIVRGGQEADGFSVELLRAALKAMGREVTFKAATWSEIKEDLADGRLQALPMVARTAEREKVFDFTFPYLTMHGTIVVREDNTEIHGPSDLKGKQVAVLNEDVAHEYLRAAGLGANIVPLPSYALAMRELSAGKYDAVVIQKLLAFQLMQEARLTNLKAVGPPLTGYNQVFCLAVRKGDKELLSVLNEGLSIVMANATFRQLHAKWFAPLEELGRSKSRIVVAGDLGYPPYEFLDRNGQPSGFNVDLTRAIARRMGLSVDIRLAHWGEVRKGLDRGEIDVVHGMFYSAERDQTFDFSPAHSVVQHVVVVREGARPVRDVQSLAGKSILVMAGDIMQDLAVKNGLGGRLVPVPTLEDALRLLAQGKHDCVLAAKLPALFSIQKNGWTHLVVPHESVLSAEYCFAVPHGNAELLSVFSEGLAAIKETGEYRAIQSKWLGPYEAPRIGLWDVTRYALFGALPIGILLVGSLAWSRSLKRQVLHRTLQLAAETEVSRQTAEALRQSEAKLRAVLDSSPDPIFLKDLQSRILLANPATCAALGKPLDQVIGKTELEVHGDPAAAHQIMENDQRVIESGRSQVIEEVVPSHNGPRTFLSTKAPYRDGAGRIVGTVGVARDITDRKRTEEALRESEMRFRVAQELSPDGFTIFHPVRDAGNRVVDFIWVYENDAIARLNGTDPKAVVGRRLLEVFPGYSETKFMQVYRQVAETGEHCVFEEKYSGETFPKPIWFRVAVVPIGSDIAVLAQDVTRQKEFEGELQRLVTERTAKLQEMVAELEHFSYSITHDMRAPLRAMQGFAEMMTEACAQCQAAQPKAFLRRIGTAAGRMDCLITDALNYSRTVRQELPLMPVDTGKLLHGMLDSYPEFQPVKAMIEVEGPLPVVMGNEAGLTQCFSNLLDNAVKFAKAGQKAEIRVWSEPREGWVRIWIEDHGIGIPESMVPKVFEMFSRGHRSYEGTGIGLALVRKVMERMGGKAGVLSEEGEGSRFWLDLKPAN